MCPCNLSFDHGATYDYCRVTLVFNIRDGESDGVDLSGRKVALIADTPKVMTEGNWRLGVFIDDGAERQQVDKLGQVLSGALGGPPAALGPLLGEFLGIEQAPISIDENGGGHHVTVGDAVDYSGTPITIEGGEPVTLSNIVAHPAGPTLGLAPVSASRVAAFGIEFSGSDLSGFSNPFHWQG
jgi:hypothetical protein